ncbi:hypothetical protein [Mixta calida]|uniref:hypothetical protein n=1 Tax=Mixta calida TaxID=665913 RepID=UPI0029088C9C|nr:hypothetical protein [Mixta calida]MDU4291095.1 hypothetical protein [Mixta calida]
MAAAKPPAARTAAQTGADASAVITPQTPPPSDELPPESESGGDLTVVKTTPATGDGNTGNSSAGPTGLIEVVVRAKHTVCHDGQHYHQNTTLELNSEDAERLRNIGFVQYLEDVQVALKSAAGVSVTTKGSVAITTGE